MKAKIEVPRFQLKASLLDAITFLKFKFHLAPNAVAAKKRICKAAGCKENIKTLAYIKLIGSIYENNGLKDDFDRVVEKFQIGNLLN